MNSNALRNPPLSPTFGAAANGQSVFFLLVGTIRRQSQNDHQKTGQVGPLKPLNPCRIRPKQIQLKGANPAWAECVADNSICSCPVRQIRAPGWRMAASIIPKRYRALDVLLFRRVSRLLDQRLAAV